MATSSASRRSRSSGRLRAPSAFMWCSLCHVACRRSSIWRAAVCELEFRECEADMDIAELRAPRRTVRFSPQWARAARPP